jgi:hypothetical protein
LLEDDKEEAHFADNKEIAFNNDFELLRNHFDVMMESY